MSDQSNGLTSSQLAHRAHAQARELMDKVCEEAVQKLTERRDEIDNAIARIEASRDTLAEYMCQFIKFTADAVVVSEGISQAVKIISEPFAATPAATLTQAVARRNGQH